MLTKLTIENFKRFQHVEIPLSDPVLFVGPNNSGKTTALQALALWDLGLRRWKEKRSEKSAPEKRPGVTINRRDLLAVPAPSAGLLWKNLRTRSVRRADGKQETQNIRINIAVEGEAGSGNWQCALEFDYSNDESFYCRPMRSSEEKSASRIPIPDAAFEVNVAYLPPMSGLTGSEVRLDLGAINVKLGEGRTAEVLRNLCYSVYENSPNGDEWERLCRDMKDLFQVELQVPEYIPERGEIQMSYRDDSGNLLDLSSAGRGLQQTLLLLSYLPLHPNSVLLLDEPDAHLEIIRQREIFLRLTDATRGSGSQLIIASHSEEVLNQAVTLSQDAVVAFLGKPHRFPQGRTEAVRKALREVSAKDYYQALQTGWVLYLEGTTDLLVLRSFANRVGHPAAKALEAPFLVPVGNQPNLARRHFDALAEMKPDVVGCLLVDADAPGLQDRDALIERKWQRREIENYLCQPETLIAYVKQEASDAADGPLLQASESERAEEAMAAAIREFVPPVALRDPDDPYWMTVKASDEFLDRVFRSYYKQRGQPLQLRKADYHRLVAFIPDALFSAEVEGMLDAIHSVWLRAKPLGSSTESEEL